MANKKAEILTMDGQVVSPITLATNVLLEDGRTAQDLLDSRDESMFSPTITTSSSISKVGQGDNVDFSENVIDGAYGSCVLKGKTLVNYNAEGNDRNEYVCMPSVEGSNLTVNGTVEGKVKSAILKGNTLVNLAPNSKVIFQKAWAVVGSIGSLRSQNNRCCIEVDVKPNTIYTIYSNSETYIRESKEDYTVTKSTDVFTNGVRVITTLSETTKLLISFRKDSADTIYTEIEESYYNVILEGDYTNVDIPYFEGMQSVRMPVLTTTGKNLFNMEWLESGYISSTGVEQVNTNCSRSQMIKVSPVNKYAASSTKNLTTSNSNLYEYDKNGIFIKRTAGVSRIFTTSETTEYIRLAFWGIPISSWESDTIQIELGSKTSYEPYKSNILTTTSKNLFDMNRPYDNLTDSQATVTQSLDEITVSSAESGIYVNANFILDKDFFAGKTVTGSCLYESDEKDIGTVQISYQDGDGEHHYQWIRTPKTFTFPNSFIGDVMLSVSANNTGTPQSNTVTVKNIQLELGSTATSYEQYSEVVLRGIGEVKDTLDLTTGELTQRIGEVVLDGSESWVKYGTYGFRFLSHSPKTVNNQKQLNNVNLSMKDVTYKYWLDNLVTHSDDVICSNDSIIGVTLGKTQIDDVASFKQWLSENPIILKYILAEKVVKTVNLSILDQDGAKIDKLFAFNDTTHYTCSSEDGSLLPTLAIEEGVKYQAIIKPSTKYSVVFNRTLASNSLTVDLGGATASVTSTTLGKDIVQITTPPTLSHNYVIFKGLGNVIKDVQVIEGEVVGDEPYFESMVDVKNPSVMNCNTLDTEDENYKSNTISTDEVVLRSLPNGVSDTLDLETGEYVQRIGEIVLDGSEEWSKYSNNTNEYNTTDKTSVFYVTIADKKVGYGTSICDTFVNTNDNSAFNMNYVKQFTYSDHLTLDRCYFDYGDNNEYTVNDFKTYLQQNPITVQYELATPIVTTIDLKQHPFAYKDGYVVLTSSSEEVSLTPTIEYSLIANRLGQIQTNQKLVEKQQAQIDELESMVIANLVNTQYQQALNEIKMGVK